MERSIGNPRIEALRNISPYYPSIHIIRDKTAVNPHKIITLSTLVRVKRGKKWYAVHCAETMSLRLEDLEDCVFLRFIESVHKIQNLYKPSKLFDEIDKLQISEAERAKGVMIKLL